MIKLSDNNVISLLGVRLNLKPHVFNLCHSSQMVVANGIIVGWHVNVLSYNE